MRKPPLLAAALLPLLSGCMTIRRNRVLTVNPEPGTMQITVAAEAVAKCYNLILVEVCSLDLQMRQIGGASSRSPQAQKVRDFIAANYAAVVEDLSEGSGQALAALLDLLRVPPDQRVDSILKMKEYNLRARGAAAFAALTVDNLLKPPPPERP